MDSQLAALTAKKARLDARRPLPAELIKNLDEWYKVELTYTSNAIEGNTLTRAETALVIDKGLTVQGKTFIEHQEALNHAKAVDYIKELARTSKPADVTLDTVLAIHNFILHNIDDTNAGRIRHVAVRVQGSLTIFPNHLKVAGLMAALVNQLHTMAQTEHPVIVAAYAHFQLVTIHPFVDGNGRTSRLLMNLLLQQAGYPPAIIKKEDRLRYINALEQARRTENLAIFYAVIIAAVDQSLDIYLDEDKTPVTAAAKRYRIGDIARLSGEPISTIRFWTEQGLLPLADRSTAGYRLYDVAAVATAQRIRRLNGQRYTLAEIKQRLDGVQ